MKNKMSMLASFLSVKSIVTIILTVVFSVLSVSDRISGEQFLTIFSVVIAFYFGTQYQKGEQERQKGGEEE
ncbi:MAG: hypothetical protein IKY38_02565 [Anaerotignum sp.]|nr:hypothetical protein [Anaerotignum sp.]MBR6542964.1 hypothetical protein [Anaerotignum sp.]